MSSLQALPAQSRKCFYVLALRTVTKDTLSLHPWQVGTLTAHKSISWNIFDTIPVSCVGLCHSFHKIPELWGWEGP